MEHDERPIKRCVYDGIKRDLYSGSAGCHVRALRALRDLHNNSYTFRGDEDYEYEPLNEDEIAWLRQKAALHERAAVLRRSIEAAVSNAKQNIAKQQQQSENVLRSGMTNENNSLEITQGKKSGDCDGGSDVNSHDGSCGNGDGANACGNANTTLEIPKDKKSGDSDGSDVNCKVLMALVMVIICVAVSVIIKWNYPAN